MYGSFVPPVRSVWRCIISLIALSKQSHDIVHVHPDLRM